MKMKRLKKAIGKIKEKIINYLDPDEIDIYSIPVSTVHRHGPLTEEEIAELKEYIDSF